MAEFDDERRNLKAPKIIKEDPDAGPPVAKPMHSEWMLYQGWLVFFLGAGALAVICYFAFRFLPNGS